MTDNVTHPQEPPLESWKEIAVYLKRDVRTVIRWEKSEGLPVHRQMHQARSSVYAYPSELDAWKVDREPRLNAPILVTPWRLATAAAAFALTVLLSFVTLASGPILTASRAVAGEGNSGVVFRQVRFDGAERTPFAQLSPDGKKMLYVRLKEEGPPFTLSIIDLSSGQEQRLVDNFGAEGPTNSFRWSADGSKVVYAQQRRELRVISSQGGESQLLWSPSDSEVIVKPLDWSRDGRSILAAVINETKWTTQLATLPALGGKPRVIVSGKLDELADSGQFSPDGKFVVGRRGEGEDAHICVWDANSGQEFRLDRPAGYSPAFWSSDGKYLVFVSDRMKTLDLWAVPMAAGRPAGVPLRLKQGLGRNTLLTGFTPAGQLTMLVTGEGTPPDLFVLPVDPTTGEARGEFAPLAKYPTEHFGPRWSPDGRHVAYTSRKGQIRMPSIFVNSADGEDEQEISNQGYYIGNIEWSPDGQQLLFAGFLRNGNVGIFRVSLDDRQITPLHLGGRYGTGYAGAFVNVQWLPLARKLMFGKITGNGVTEIYTMSNDGKQVERVVEEVPTSYWTWPSPDGRQIAYRQGQDLRLLNLADKSSLTLATLPQGSVVSGPAWSTDARTIAFTDTQRLKVLSATDSAPKVLVEAPEGYEIGGTSWWSGLTWSPDGSSVAYLLQKTSKASGAASELWAVSAAGGRPRRIAVAPASHPVLSDAMWLSGGKRIVVTGNTATPQKRLYEHWVMEDFLPALQAAK